jgi:hypothetical protein
VLSFLRFLVVALSGSLNSAGQASRVHAVLPKTHVDVHVEFAASAETAFGWTTVTVPRGIDRRPLRHQGSKVDLFTNGCHPLMKWCEFLSANVIQKAEVAVF